LKKHRFRIFLGGRLWAAMVRRLLGSGKDTRQPPKAKLRRRVWRLTSIKAGMGKFPANPAEPRRAFLARMHGLRLGGRRPAVYMLNAMRITTQAQGAAGARDGKTVRGHAWREKQTRGSPTRKAVMGRDLVPPSVCIIRCSGGGERWGDCADGKAPSNLDGFDFPAIRGNRLEARILVGALSEPPRVLRSCWTDPQWLKVRGPYTNFAALGNSRLSYFIGTGWSFPDFGGWCGASA